jgi:hypothetical protein
MSIYLRAKTSAFAASLRRHRPRLDQRDVNAAALQLHALRQHQPFERIFRCDIGAAQRRRHQTEDRRAVNDAPCPCRRITGTAICVNSCQPKNWPRTVRAAPRPADPRPRPAGACAPLLKSASSRPPVAPSPRRTRRVSNSRRDSPDRARPPTLAAKLFQVFLLARGREHAISVVAEPKAQYSPMPVEQPVMRIVGCVSW